MSAERCQIALKEWAVTARALAEGRQILLLRKGGIHEDSKDFRVVHREFLLYPTYEHQKAELLKPVHQPELKQILAQAPAPDAITFTHLARVHELHEISQQSKVDDLSPHYIWTDAYAQSRLYWKPNVPLTVLLLRVYRLGQPVTVKRLPEYDGCKSWVDIIPDVNLGRLEPALSDADFARKVDDVRGSLGLVRV